MQPLTTTSVQQKWQTALSKISSRVSSLPAYRVSGRVVRATGMVLEVTGLELPLGSACKIELDPDQNHDMVFAEAEVGGFRRRTRLFDAVSRSSWPEARGPGLTIG